LNGLRNPTWPGPYGAGSVEIEFVKNSETPPNGPRPLRTVIYYPTDQPSEDPGSEIVIDAPFASDVGALPLIMFSHGSCGIPVQSPFLTGHLASYGFIVAAPPHPGNQLSDPGCGTPQAQVDSFLNRPADISFVIDEMLALNADASSMFFGHVDGERIGMSGHSFGGLTTFRVAALDDRIDAGLPLAPANIAIDNDLTFLADNPIPIMIQGAANDSTTPFAQHQQVPFDRLVAPRYLLKLFLNAGHLGFSAACIPNLALGCPEHRFIVRYALPFLLANVTGDHQFDAYLDPMAVPPGVEYTPDP
jgi:predicted dienelactone hydrolase